MDRLRILYVGPDYPGSNGTCWRDAFAELGHDVLTIDEDRYAPIPKTFAGRVRRRLRGMRPPQGDIETLNRAVTTAAREFKPSLSFFIKAYYVLPDVLEETRRYGLNFAYMNDDMFVPGVRTFTFFENIRRMDCILTTKSFSVREYHAAGAPLALYIPNAYDPKIHYPAKPDRQEYNRYRGDVAFIGTFRPSKADALMSVASFQSYLRLNVWGGSWDHLNRIDYWPRTRYWRALRPCVRGKELWCAEMGKAIQSNEIVLGLLCREVRDLHTSRSFEIPACGGFMLAERTDEHLEYFQEGKEAAYFGSTEELLDKIWFYWGHESLRKRIAAAGHDRCIRGGHRYVDRAAFAVQQYRRLRGENFGIPLAVASA